MEASRLLTTMQETGNSGSVRSISVQVSLSGYVSRIETDGVSDSSGWMSADRFFTDARFQRRYDDVSISVFTPKFTLVPEHFFDPLSLRELLGDVADLDDSDHLSYEPVPEFKAYLVYSDSMGETLSRAVADTVRRADGSKAAILPEIRYMLSGLEDISDYNKVVVSYADGYLYLVISQGRSLLLCNSYRAADFVTAEYFIFLAMKKLQLNMEMTTVYFRTPLKSEEEMSLYRYFKAVDYL